MKKSTGLIISVFLTTVSLIVGAGCTEIQPPQTSSDPASVAAAFLDASSSNDMEKGLSLLSEDIVFRQEPAGIEIKGKANLEQLFQENATFQDQHQLTSSWDVEGDTATCSSRVSSDDFRIMGIEHMDATYEFRVREGKIYSILVTVAEEDWKKVIEHNSGGVGIKPSFTEEGMRIEEFAEQSAAKDAGLNIGDLIIAIDGTSCSGITQSEMLLRIKGPVGSKVNLTVLREGLDKPFNVEVTRISLQ